MNKKKPRIIVLTHGGAERFLELLSAVDSIEIAGVFVETATEKHRSVTEKLRRSIRYDGYFATFKKLATTFFVRKSNITAEAYSVEKSQSDLAKCAERLNIRHVTVENYHSGHALNLLRQADADLGVLYGTNIIKEAVFTIPRLGSINIHQAHAPLYRGGPTIFWELFNDEKEVGITVHFVAPAVDTGDIVLQRSVPLEYDYSRYGLNYEDFLTDFRASLKEPSAKLLVEAVCQVVDGKEQRTKQDTSIGKRYKLPIKSEKDELLRLLTKRRKPARLN
jgi:folate-dependent phosphoribosylglycinamide formyltransferase PurN